MQPFKIKIACLSYADLLLRFNRRLSFLFLERERMRLKIKFPSSFAWAWDQQDLTAKQVNPGGVATSKKKKKFTFFYCKMAVSCWIMSLMISSSVKWLPASELCWEMIDSIWSRKSS